MSESVDCGTHISSHGLIRSSFLLNTTSFVGGIVVILFNFLFILPWWNKYLGITNEGWYQFFGKSILDGRIPYRDFYLFVPPAQPLTMAALTLICGNRVIVPELFGFAGAIVLAAVLYLWLVRLFPAFWVIVAVICTSAVYLRFPPEPLSGLHLNANLYPILALLAASFALHQPGGSGRLLILTGFWAGMALVTKQTAGVAVTTALGIMLPGLIANRSGVRAGLRVAGMLAIGWCVPVLFSSIWLAMHGAWRDFLEDVFLNGPSSKGSITSLLGRQIEGILSSRYLGAAAALAFLIVLTSGLLFYFMPNATNGTGLLSRKREAFYMWTFGAVVIGLTIWAQHWPNALPSKLHRVDLFSQYVLIYLGELGSLALLCRYGWLVGRRKLNWCEEQLLLGAGTSFVCAFLFSFSWASDRLMLLPACPFVLAFGLSRLSAGKVMSLVKTLAVVVVLIVVAVAAGSKMRRPYFWADWQEGDALRATVALDFPELRGIRVTPETAAFLRQIVGDIQQYSRPSDPVAEFPAMPILYMLAHRTPATFAYIHYIDVTPDHIYARDVETVERDPPAIIITLRRTETELKEGEIYFRNGQHSGERTLWETLEGLSRKYQVVDILQTPNTNRQVEVWVRR